MKINYTKSEALNLTLHPDPLARVCASCSFKWEISAITYLGIRLTGNLVDTYNANFLPLLNNIQKDVKGWTTRPLSLFGRAAILKMVILPRILCHFHTMPLPLPCKFYLFIWMGPKPRIKPDTLTEPKEWGGIGLPGFKLYHFGIHLARILDWNCHREQKVWITLEEASLTLSLRFLPWIP